MKKLLLICSLFFTLQAQMIDGISIIIEDKIITLYDIKQEMQLAHVSKKQAIDILIRKKLEEIEIKKRGIQVSKEEIFNEIKKLAQANHMSLNQFYDLVREKNNLTSEELQEKIKEQLLSQKLYQSIALSKMDQPDETQIEEYYKLHKKEFLKPSFIDVVVYSANEKTLLLEKQNNPMFYSNALLEQEQRLNTDTINPQLLQLLLNTKEGHFTPIIPNPPSGFLMFYIQQFGPQQEMSLEMLKPEIINAIMSEKRAEILDDYFAKLRDSADIKIIRE